MHHIQPVAQSQTKHKTSKSVLGKRKAHVMTSKSRNIAAASRGRQRRRKQLFAFDVVVIAHYTTNRCLFVAYANNAIEEGTIITALDAILRTNYSR